MNLDWLSVHSLGQLAKVCLIGAFLLWLIRVQRNPANGIDLLEFIQDPTTGKLSGFRLAYMVALWATTYKYVSTPMTASEMSVVMVTYGGLWVVGQTAAKFIDRPPDPPQPVAPIVPQTPAAVVVNNQTDGSARGG